MAHARPRGGGFGGYPFLEIIQEINDRLCPPEPPFQNPEDGLGGSG